MFAVRTTRCQEIVFSHHDPDGAYYGTHKLGRDPDPNVREAIIDAHIYERGAF